MVLVGLSWHEVSLAVHVASQRQISDFARGRKHRWNKKNPYTGGWDDHVVGAIGEMAVAKHTNQYWSGALGNLKADDAGLLQVRASADHGNRLILHPDDPDDKRFVFVTMEKLNQPYLRGWMWAHVAKNESWWSDPYGGRPAFFIDTDALEPVETLMSGGT